MNHQFFRDLLDLFMVSDPWPDTPESHLRIEDVLDDEARERGYENWVVAFHEFHPDDELVLERLAQEKP